MNRNLAHSESRPQRKIIHFDMDCFFAAIEMRNNPKLKNIPMAVGGPPEKRGVLATCNYPARKYGLHSGMATAHALRLCPHLHLVSGQHQNYRQVSDEIMAILAQYQLPLEVCSLDEAYLDATGIQTHYGSATLLSREIRQKIYQQTQLTCSAGIAPNRYLAKICSDWHKPNGEMTLTPEQVDTFILSLPVEKIPGVGPVCQQKLNQLGLYTCRDLREYGEQALIESFHKFGQALFQYANGVDERPIGLTRERKSLSCENTFATDLEDFEQIWENFSAVKLEFLRRLKKWSSKHQKNQVFQSLFIKMKFMNFESVTACRGLQWGECQHLIKCLEMPSPVVSNQKIDAILSPLLSEAYQRKKMPVRLLGMGVKLKQNITPAQLSLF